MGVLIWLVEGGVGKVKLAAIWRVSVFCVRAGNGHLQDTQFPTRS